MGNSYSEFISDDPAKKTIRPIFLNCQGNACELICHKQVSFGYDEYLFANKINLQNGSLMWDTAKQITAKSTSYNAKYSGAVMESGVYYGYSTGENMRFDGYLQRVILIVSFHGCFRVWTLYHQTYS